MHLPIAVFGVMAEIAKENKIRSIKWARASELSPSRISDFKRLAKKTKAGAAEPDQAHAVWRHTFSLNNFFTLYDGLRRLVGASALRKGLMRQIETKKLSIRVRIFRRLMTFNDGQLKLVDAFTDALLHRVNATSNRSLSWTFGSWASKPNRATLSITFISLGEMRMENTKGQEEIDVGKGTCVVSWPRMGKEELFCALGTLMDLIECGDRYREMPLFVDAAFKREFQTIMKTFKAPSEKRTWVHKEPCAR